MSNHLRRLLVDCVDVKQSILFEEAAIMGAVAAYETSPRSDILNTADTLRLARQALLPVFKREQSG